MLSYAFQTLKQETYEDVAVESFDEMYNLLAAILASQGHRAAVEAGTLQRIYKSSGRANGYAW